jgi:hypothetical protein
MRLCWLTPCTWAACLTLSVISAGNRKHTALLRRPGMVAGLKVWRPAWMASRIKRLLGTWDLFTASARRRASSSVRRTRPLHLPNRNFSLSISSSRKPTRTPSHNFQSTKRSELATSCRLSPTFTPCARGRKRRGSKPYT